MNKIKGDRGLKKSDVWLKIEVRRGVRFEGEWGLQPGNEASRVEFEGKRVQKSEVRGRDVEKSRQVRREIREVRN